MAEAVRRRSLDDGAVADSSRALVIHGDRRAVAAFTAENPDAEIIKLGIGDVTEPLAPESVADAARGLPAAVGAGGAVRIGSR